MADGRRRENWAHTSNILALLFNVNLDPKKGKPAKPSDFDPFTPKKKSTPIPIKMADFRSVFMDVVCGQKPPAPARVAADGQPIIGAPPIAGPTRSLGPLP